MPFSCRALLVSMVLLLCHFCAPVHGDSTTTLYNKTIDVPFSQRCMAARMDYVGRNCKDCALRHVDALQHYQRRGHADGLSWDGSLCDVQPIYQNDSVCQCPLAISTYVADNPFVKSEEAWQHYLQFQSTYAPMWHCEKCLGNYSETCILARRDYRLRYNLGTTVEPYFHYYTWGIYKGYIWNSSLCFPPNMSSVIYMDNDVSNCREAETWYDKVNPNAASLNGYPTAYKYYQRYSMEYGTFWYEELCVDAENECVTGNNNCTEAEKCTNQVGDTGSFSCSCAIPFYTGSSPNCIDVDECTSNTANLCNPNATCNNTIGGYNCICNPGFTGNGTTCLDLDECTLGIDECLPAQKCVNTFGDYECQCPMFYENVGKFKCDYICTFPFKSCSEGRCISIDTDSCAVPPVCDSVTPFLCANQSCVQSTAFCVGNDSQIDGCFANCWDGSCALSADQCPTVPECPVTLRRCLDGTCKATCTDSACVSPNHACSDGTCAKSCAINWNGCPTNLPYMCQNGVCKNNTSDCARGNLTAPRTQRAQVMTVFFPVGSVGPSEPNITIPVLSVENLLIVKLLLSDTYFANEDGALTVTPVPDSVTYAAGRTLWGEGFEPSSKIFSGPVDINITGSPHIIGKMYYVYFDASIIGSMNVSNLCVGIINETSNEWSCFSKLHMVNGSITGSAISGRMAIIQPNNIAAVPHPTYKHQRTVGIYLFAAIVVLYSVGLLFGSLRDRKIFLEIVTETIKREGSITGISGIPYQAAASEEPEAPKDREEIQRELARRGVSMPNIILPDEVRARHMSHTKHAVVLSGDRSISAIPYQPAEYLSMPVTERTARAMTFDAAYQPTSLTSSATESSIPPFNARRALRSGSIATHAVATESRSGPVESRSVPVDSPLSFHHAPVSSLRSFRLSNRNSNSKNVLFSSQASITTDDDPKAHEMDDLSTSQDLVYIPSPTPLVPRVGSFRENAKVQEQARKLEWEVSLRAQMTDELDLRRLPLWELMKLKHSWLSVWFTERSSRLTCVEQLTILLCMVIGNLGISAPFFHNSTHFDISKSIIVAIITASLVLIVTILISIMLQKTKKTHQTLAVFGIAFVFSCFCVSLAMIYSYYFVVEATEMWVVAFALSCTQDVVVNQPFKVLLIALINGCLPNDHWLVRLL